MVVDDYWRRKRRETPPLSPPKSVDPPFSPSGPRQSKQLRKRIALWAAEQKHPNGVPCSSVACSLTLLFFTRLHPRHPFLLPSSPSSTPLPPPSSGAWAGQGRSRSRRRRGRRR